MAYTIQINEEQRAIIAAALQEQFGGEDAFPAGAPINEGALLRDMFAALQKEEAAAPGSLHGFCL